MSNLVTALCSLIFAAGVSLTAPAVGQDMQTMLDSVREQSGVKGIAVSIIETGQPDITLTSGFANEEKRIPVSAKTQFRFGSVSKMLVAMSVMKLVEEEQLSLDSKVATLAPEVRFDNPWAAEHPLRLKHLLNHTTGWDAMHFAENVAQDNKPIDIKQALELHPHSRQSRWPPGSRFAYNNNGPLVAAYLIEKISGISFESFVKKHFFQPLNMTDSDYFFTDAYREYGATLYLGDEPLPYVHLNNRAAGGLNSCVRDMSTLVHFLLAQGKGSASKIISTDSLQSLQTPQGSLAANQGLELTYALGINLFHANGHIIFGHEGSVRGGAALLAYLPELGKGYVIAVNGEGPAIPRIHEYLANMITQSAKPEQLSTKSGFSLSQQALSGMYRVINPTSSLIAPMSSLMPWKLKVTQNRATIGPLFGMPPRQLGSHGDDHFSQWESGKVVMLSVDDPVAGNVVQYGPMTLKPISKLKAYLPIIMLVLWILTMVIAVLFALAWVSRRLLGKKIAPVSLHLRSWPLLTLLPLIAVGLLVIHAKNRADVFILAGQPSWLSVGIFCLSVLFFVSSLWSLFIWWKTPRQSVSALVYWHSTVLIFLNGIVATYLLVNGLVGVKLWA